MLLFLMTTIRSQKIIDKVRRNQSRNKTPNVKASQYDINSVVRNQLKNKFDIFQDTSNTHSEW